DLLGRVPSEVLQEGRLARARATGDEHVLACVFDQAEQRLLLGGEGRRGHRFMVVRADAAGPPRTPVMSSGVRLCPVWRSPFLDWDRGPGGGRHRTRARSDAPGRPGDPAGPASRPYSAARRRSYDGD